MNSLHVIGKMVKEDRNFIFFGNYQNWTKGRLISDDVLAVLLNIPKMVWRRGLISELTCDISNSCTDGGHTRKYD